MDKEVEFKEIYQKYVKDIYRFSYFSLNNKENAEDITSDTFIRLYEYGLENLDNVRPWLYKVCRNLIYDRYYRSNMQKNNINVEENEFDELENIFGSKDLESAVLDSHTVDLIQKELETVDTLTAEIIVLRLWEEFKFSEIAEMLDLKENTVKQRFYRGIEEIKNRFETQKGVKGKLIGVPISSIVLAGLVKVSLVPTYAASISTLSKISADIVNTLDITTNIMLGMTAAGATAKASGGLIAGITSKFAIGTVAAVTAIGGGVGTAYYVDHSNKNPNEKVIGESELIVEKEELTIKDEDKNKDESKDKDECEISTYKNDIHPEFTFQYRTCDWTLTETRTATSATPEFAPVADTLEVKLTDKSNNELIFNLLPAFVFGFGPRECINNDFKIIKSYGDSHRDSLGRFLTADGMWAYSPTVYEYVAERDFIDRSMTAEDSTFCQEGGFVVKTNTYNKFTNNGNNIYAITTIKYDGESEGTLKADEVIKSLIWFVRTEDDSIDADATTISNFNSNNYNLSFGYSSIYNLESNLNASYYNNEYVNLKSEYKTIGISYPVFEGGYGSDVSSTVISKDGHEFKIYRMMTGENADKFTLFAIGYDKEIPRYSVAIMSEQGLDTIDEAESYEQEITKIIQELSFDFE
jgi:RNA polymerase sigma factor (sigma-70 family)